MKKSPRAAFKDLQQDFNILLRIVRTYVFPYLPLVLFSIFFSILVASCFTGSVSASKPICDTLFEPQGFEKLCNDENLNYYAPWIAHWLKNTYGHLPETEQTLEVFKLFLSLTILILILQYLFRFVEEYSIGLVVERISRDISNDLYQHFQKMDIGFLNEMGVSKVLSAFTNDVTYVNRGIKTLFGKVIQEPLKIIFMVILAFSINFWMAFVAFTVVPFIFIGIYFISRRVKKHTKSYLKRRGNLVSLISDTLYGARIVQVFGMEEEELRRFSYENEKTYQSNVKILFYDVLSTPLIVVSGSIVAGIAIYFAAKQVISGEMSRGSFFTFYIALGALSDPIRKLSNVFNRIQGAVVASRNVFDILDTPPQIQDDPQPVSLPASQFQQQIEFRSVSFAYGKDAKEGKEGKEKNRVLKNLNFTVHKGEIVAIVGQSGAGKSTLVNLIPRFYDCLEGDIFLDGIPLRKIKLKSLRQLLGIVTQETLLFNTSIQENIAYGSPGASLEAIQNAAKKANVHQFVLETKNQYQTLIGEQGIQLSGGQRQRLSIARAILKDPQILILDEAASSLDSVNEQQILAALEEFMVDRTTFVIAHRLSTIVNADKILVLQEGEIVGYGTHQELLQHNPHYQALYQYQFAPPPPPSPLSL
jgi:subfamily B ATP-binding cassette protein MsbA